MEARAWPTSAPAVVRVELALGGWCLGDRRHVVRPADMWPRPTGAGRRRDAQPQDPVRRVGGRRAGGCSHRLSAPAHCRARRSSGPQGRQRLCLHYQVPGSLLPPTRHHPDALPVRRPRCNGTCEVSGRWAKRRAEAAARQRGSVAICQDDLDTAVTFAGTMPRIEASLCDRFQRCVAEQLVAVAKEQGVAFGSHLQDHLRRSLGHVAAQQALLLHILTIEGVSITSGYPRQSRERKARRTGLISV